MGAQVGHHTGWQRLHHAAWQMDRFSLEIVRGTRESNGRQPGTGLRARKRGRLIVVALAIAGILGLFGQLCGATAFNSLRNSRLSGTRLGGSFASPRLLRILPAQSQASSELATDGGAD